MALAAGVAIVAEESNEAVKPVGVLLRSLLLVLSMVTPRRSVL